MLIIFWLLSANAFSSDSIAPGSIPIALSTPGTAGLSLSPQYSVYQPTAVQGLSLSTQQQSGTNTNTAQSSSWTSNPLTNIYDILSPIPSDIASTAANLAKYLGSIPSYTPGGAPTVGGQFPYNYPITQTNITNNIMVQRTIYK